MNVLDTDMIRLYQQGNNKVVARANQEQQLTISIVTKAEMLRGRVEYLLKAATSQQVLQAQSWLEQTELFLKTLNIVPFDSGAAAELERLRKIKKVKNIGLPDLMIAGIVLAHKATLITGNVRDFRLVPGLKSDDWSK
jgi:tRNA(fMet)-specific endonuclease VapC